MSNNRDFDFEGEDDNELSGLLDYDNDNEENQQEEEDSGNRSEYDEQHAQKVNGQIEILQHKIDTLTRETHRYADENRLMRRGFLELEHKLRDLNNPIIDEVIPDMASDSDPLLFLNYIFEAMKKQSEESIERQSSNRRAGGVDNISSSRISTLSKAVKESIDMSEVVNVSVKGELIKLCSKVNLPQYLTETPTEISNDKCIYIIKAANRVLSDQANKIHNLESELKLAFTATEDIKALKAKLIQLVERIRIDKENKHKLEGDIAVLKKKQSMLTDHTEKLMSHLKHETANKIRITEQLKASEKDYTILKEQFDVMQRKGASKDRLILELREGSKILEDQLKLMDEKYLELRTKLDFAREVGAIRLKKAETTANELRAKFALATNSTMILDKIPLPNISSYNTEEYTSILQESSVGTLSKKKSSKRLQSIPSTAIQPEMSMEKVLEKIRIQENKKKDWNEDDIRNLATDTYKKGKDKRKKDSLAGGSSYDMNGLASLQSI